MPNRYIKESCTNSPTLAVLSDASERLFWRLTTVADDYGRFDAHPAILFGRCVPRLKWSIQKVEKSFSELCQIAEGDEIPLVQLYRVSGRLYGRLTNWANHQRDRSKEQNPPKPKFPGPEDGAIVTPQSAATCGDLRRLAALNESESDNDNDNEERTTPQIAASEFDVVWTAYPRKVGKQAAQRAWQKLHRSRPPVSALLAAIERQKGSAQWKKDGGEFIPHLATWLNQARWEDELAVTGDLPVPLTPKAFRKLATVTTHHEPMPENIRALIAQAGKGKGMPI